MKPGDVKIINMPGNPLHHGLRVKLLRRSPIMGEWLVEVLESRPYPGHPEKPGYLAGDRIMVGTFTFSQNA